MSITECIKTYNIYDCAGCSEEDTLEQWSDKIVLWLEETFGEYVDVSVFETTISTVKAPAYYIYILFKATSVGVYFMITKTDNLNNYVHVGYVCDTSTTIKENGITGITGNNKNLKLLIINSNGTFFMVPVSDILENSMCAFSKLTEQGNVGFLYTASDVMYVSEGSAYVNIDYAFGKRSACDKKLIYPFAVPTKNYLFRDIFKSDGTVIENFAVYQINERYFVDVCISDESPCITLELFEEV